MLALHDIVVVVAVLISVAIVYRGYHFPNLCDKVGITVRTSSVVDRQAHCAHHALHQRAIGTHRHDVEDGFGALGVIFCSRVGNHLYLLDGAGGNCLEHILHVLTAQCRVGMAVAIHLERR